MPVTFLPRQKTSRSASRSAGKSSGKATAGRGTGGRGSAGKASAAGTRRRLDLLFGRRDLILRLCLVAAACAAVVAAVRGWEPPMRQRLGDFAADGIAARVPFAVEDRLRTERERERNAASVRAIFRNDPSRLTPLVDQFRRELSDLASAESLSAVPRQVRTAFGLVVPPPAEVANPEAAGTSDPAAAAPAVAPRPSAAEVRVSEDEFGAVRSALMSQPVEGDNPRPGV